MKKLAAILLSLVFCMGAGACGEKNPEGDPTPPPEPPKPLADNSGMDDSKYVLKTYLYPIWEGTTVYNETLWFAGENSAPLLYEPDEILSVRSYDLKTVYSEEDYVVEGRELYLTNNSRIPYMTPSAFFPALPPTPSIAVPGPSGGYFYIAEGTDISLRQVVVTYTHASRRDWTLPSSASPAAVKETAARSALPADCSEKFPETMRKLENGERLKVVFYGDSITVGANASGFLGCEPGAESYAEMVESYMRARYPEADIQCVNNAVGGTDSNWAINRKTGLAGIDNILSNEADHLKTRVLSENPDLLFIAYGMNDPYFDAVQYQLNIETIIEEARKVNPNVEIMLVSGMIANPETPFHNKDYEAYQKALASLSEKYERVGLATVLNTVRSLYEGKRFQDCTANNANHPNDFMMRVYAQTVVASLFGTDYIDAI